MEINASQCRKDQIAAYLDGELDAGAGSLVERHVKNCRVCEAELNAQRLFILELDFALALPPELPVPPNFAEIVAARAESDMSGVRNGIEHRRALRFCMILALTSFALLGAAASKAVFFSGQAIVVKVLGILGLLWMTLHDAAVGLAVISRVVSAGMIPESPFAGLAALFLALAVILLSLLISSYHQHRELELSD